MKNVSLKQAGLPQISFKTTREEAELIGKIVDRYADIVGADRVDYMSLNMDLSACHANGNPLDFWALLNAPKFDFCHDIGGIARHINRETGQLENCFSPRTSLREVAK